ncbi:MAG TPA: hypothetical protein VK509_13340 [Polyangiales bacterium]|nr:hypothetical protein [Polyangiales bacterium]
METVTPDLWWMRAPLAAAVLLSGGCDPSSFDELTQRDDAATGGEVQRDGDAGGRAGTRGAMQQLTRDGGGPDASVRDGSSREVDAGVARTQPGDAGAAHTALPIGDASPDEQPDGAMSCGDPLRDAKNCGFCGYDCAAPSATVSCVNAMCNRTCESGYGDCDSDLVHGSEGNGCESRVDNDVNQCGACRKRCVAPEYGIATCSDRLCSGHTVVLTDFAASLPHGNTTGGGPFSTVCLDGEVMTGISGLGDSNIVYALRVHCARLELKRSSGITSVSTRATWMTDMVGGVNLVPVASFSLACPPNTIVTKVSGSTSYYNDVVTVPSIKRLSLTCSALKVDTDFAMTLAAGTTMQIGQDAAAPIEVFNEPCKQLGAVAGLSGRSGAYLDAIAVHCGKLTVRQAPAGTVTAPAAGAKGSKNSDVAE